MKIYSYQRTQKLKRVKFYLAITAIPNYETSLLNFSDAQVANDYQNFLAQGFQRPPFLDNENCCVHKFT